jgi:osmoprotectant transport system substrate-binding protein
VVVDRGSVSSGARFVAAVVLGLVLAACLRPGRGPQPAPHGALDDDAITVGSFDFPESEVLAEIYSKALETKGFRVIRQFDIGTRELVEPALERGLVELVPEYVGSALEFLGAAGPPLVGGAPTGVSSSPASAHASLVRAFALRGITVLAASPAQDQNGFAVTAQTAATYHLRRLSDLGAVAGSLTIGGPPECERRPLCLPGLASTYGLHFKRFQPLDASGPITTEAIRTGRVDVALMFTTDGDLQPNGFQLLVDDRHLQPAENVTPVMSSEVIQRFGRSAVTIIDGVSAQLTTLDLRSLNAQIADGHDLRQVAASWLATHGPKPPE